MEREKPVIKNGTKMVVRRPDGLGTAQVTTDRISTTPASDAKVDSLVRPHSTVQRAHSTVIPRGSKAKKSAAANDRNGAHQDKRDELMSRLGQFQGLEGLLKAQVGLNGKDNSAKQRVGVNPVLGNAGVMWESGTKRASIPQVSVPSEFPTYLSKRKSSTPDLAIHTPKKSKFEPIKLENIAMSCTDTLGAKRRELDNYTGCLPAHMLHLLPMTQKAALTNALSSPEMTAELATLLQQYQALQAAAGLANPDFSKNFLGGIDTSALLQLQLLQAFQRQTAELSTIPPFPLGTDDTVSPLAKAPTTSIHLPLSSPYKITPVNGGRDKSKVKCLKTAQIPKIAQAQIDSNVKLSSFSGIKMTPAMSKPVVEQLPTFTTKSSISSLSATELWLNLVGEQQSRLTSMLYTTGATAEVRVKLPTGEEEVFKGKCSARKRGSRIEVDVVDVAPATIVDHTANIIGHNLASLQAQARLLASSLSQNPFQIQHILPNFNIDMPTVSLPSMPSMPDSAIPTRLPTQWTTPSPRRESSPEIIVDKLTPEDVPARSNFDVTPTTTPTRNKGPKKNFLARQAALDAKMSILRAKVESEAASSSTSTSVNGHLGSMTIDPVVLEMSDNELIEGHVDR